MNKNIVGYSDKALLGSLLVMLGGVLLTQVLGPAGFSLIVILQIIVFPLYCFIVGWFGGTEFRKNLLMPLFPAAFYMAAMWMVYEIKDIEVLKFGALYFVLGYAGLLLNVFVQKARNK